MPALLLSGAGVPDHCQRVPDVENRPRIILRRAVWKLLSVGEWIQLRDYGGGAFGRAALVLRNGSFAAIGPIGRSRPCSRR